MSVTTARSRSAICAKAEASTRYSASTPPVGRPRDGAPGPEAEDQGEEEAGRQHADEGTPAQADGQLRTGQHGARAPVLRGRELRRVSEERVERRGGDRGLAR